MTKLPGVFVGPNWKFYDWPCAVLTLKARKAALEGATRQELPELPLDELRQPSPVAGLRRRAQEGLQVLADDLMEHSVLGVSRVIHGLWTRHPSG